MSVVDHAYQCRFTSSIWLGTADRQIPHTINSRRLGRCPLLTISHHAAPPSQEDVGISRRIQGRIAQGGTLEEGGPLGTSEKTCSRTCERVLPYVFVFHSYYQRFSFLSIKSIYVPGALNARPPPSLQERAGGGPPPSLTDTVTPTSLVFKSEPEVGCSHLAH